MPYRWVIRWKSKQMDDGTIKKAVEARLCGKGFADPQRQGLLTYSPTAGDTSQKLVVHIAVSYGFEVISVDITAAFLQGLTFDELDKLYTKFGVKGKVKREVFMGLPPDVWELLHGMGETPAKRAEWPNLCWQLLKAIYGLDDAPQLFNLAL
eukprot:15084059-Heterocapsa_arctica.AAC.1